VGGALLLAVLPWLGTKFVVPALPVAVALVAWTHAAGRRLAALVAAEVMLGSLVFYATLNERLYGGVTPYAADRAGQTATDAAFPLGYLERIPRLASLWLDRDYGLLRWAPVLALAGFAGWLLWRSRRAGVARAVPERRVTELAAGLLLAACAGQLAVAVFGAPTMYGFWFPGRHFVAALPLVAGLCGWGLRHAPRAGAALGALTLLASAWLLVALRTETVDGWVAPDTELPWGPLERALPLFGTGSAWADVVGVALAASLGALIAREWWRRPRASASTPATRRG
jgi:hypothetical protein